MYLSFSCLNNEGNKRLSSYLETQFNIYSKRQLKQVIKDAKFSINGKKVNTDIVPKNRDLIEFDSINLEFSIGSKRVSLEGHKLEVIKELENYLIIRKPRQMHSVIISASDPTTLADLIFESYPETLNAGRAKQESGLVQRLDFYTSGLVIAARDRETWEFLHDKFTKSKVLKEYHAFVEGKLEIDKDIDSHYIKTLDLQESGTLVQFKTKNGSRHIVRKVLSSLGHPLVGDKEYGSKKDKVIFIKDQNKLEYSGFYLEAVEIIIDI